MTKYRGIALEGGGVAGTAYGGLGLILEEIGLYDKLTHFAGSSAGAMIAALMACRVPAKQIKETLLELDFRSLEDSWWLVLANIYHLVHDYGWNTGESLKALYEGILEKQIGDKDITYAQVKARYGTTLITTSTDIVLKKTIYRSPETSPTMTVLEGIRESASIPPLYCPVSIGDTMMVDGGLLDNYPIRYLYRYLPKEQVFGAKLVSGEIRSRLSPVLPENVLKYLKLLIEILHEQNLRIHVKKEDWIRTIPIDVGQVSAVDFDISQEDKMKLIETCKVATKKFFLK